MRGPSLNDSGGPRLDRFARQVRAMREKPELWLIVVNAICAVILVVLTVVLVLQGG